jgi:hypothetical protein
MKRDLMLHAQWAAAPVRAASGALLYLLLVAGQALARASEPIRRKCRNRSPGTEHLRAACKFWAAIEKLYRRDVVHRNPSRGRL